MLIDYEWLREYCDCDLPVEKAASRLTMAGLNVENIEETESGRTVLDVEVTADRTDCNSYLGVARELSVLSGESLSIPPAEVPAKEVEQLEDVSVSVKKEDRDLCPRYSVRIVRDVDVGPSPDWLQSRLESMGLQPVNNIVDITNYVLYETGQPLHAFDLETLQESAIVVRRARSGEKITTLDGKERELSTDHLVIADGKDPAAIAGVMGGNRTEVGNRTDTVLIESALFDPVNIRRTSRSLGLTTESSYRFERGPDPEMVDYASRRAADLMQEIAGGTVQEAYADRNYLSDDSSGNVVTLRNSRLKLVLGEEVSSERMSEILIGLGFVETEKQNGTGTYEVPSFRPDVEREEDLIEEVARIYGYDNISDDPDIHQTLAVPDRDTRVRNRIRQILSGFGLNEICTFPFLDDQDDTLSSYWTQDEPVGILDAYGEVDRYLRRSLIPGFLNVLNTNHGYGKKNLSFFEIARSYRWAADEEVDEQEILCLLREDGFRRTKGDVEALLQELLREEVEYREFDLDILHPDESAELYIGQYPIGYVGSVKKSVLEDRNVQGEPCVCELDYGVLRQRTVLENKFEEFSRFPPSDKDLAFVLDDTVTWEDLQHQIRESSPSELERIELFDVFRGGQIPEGKRSVALRLVFRSSEGTLERDQVNQWLKTVVDSVESNINASLRGDLE